MRTLVCVPTVPGREAHLQRCLSAYALTTCYLADAVDVRVYEGYATCGEAWNAAGDFARIQHYDCLHLSADDLEPLPGWYEAAGDSIDRGASPSALIRTGATGQIESHGAWGVEHLDCTPQWMTRIPFLRTTWWAAIPPIHYFSDNAVSALLHSEDVPIEARTGYAFRHWWAEEARKPMNDANWFREQAIYQAYAAARSVEAG